MGGGEGVSRTDCAGGGLQVSLGAGEGGGGQEIGNGEGHGMSLWEARGSMGHDARCVGQGSYSHR